MSLKIWLPLNNNINNQGLTDWTPTIQSGTTAAYVNGKIGKALHTGGIVMPASVTKEVLNNNEFSYACWLYVGGESGSTQSAMIFGNNSGRQFSMFQYPTANDFHYSWANYENGTWSSYWGGVLSGVLPSNQWTHIAVVYNNNITDKLKIYINGVSQTLGSRSFVSKSTSFEFDTQLIHNSTYHYLNDVRLYDHALSPLEVKRLSQGLVLHYRLSGSGAENLLSNDKSNWGAYTCSSGRYSGSSSRFAPYKITIPISPSTKYICHITDHLNLGEDFYIGVHQLDSSETFLNDSGWKKAPYTFISRDDAAYVRLVFRDGLNNTTNIQNYINAIGSSVLIKFEESDHPTPWCPNPSDPEYHTMGFDDGIEYDCSGFGNNGTKIGTIVWDSNTARYNSCYAMTGTSYINCGKPYEFIPDGSDEFTVNMWAYEDAWDTSTQLCSCTESGGFSLSTGNNAVTCYCHVYRDSSILTNSSGETITNSSGDTILLSTSAQYIAFTQSYTLSSGWHMFTMVYTKEGLKIYVDGSLVRNSESSSIGLHYNKNCNLFIGAEANGSGGCTSPYLEGKASDYRLFSTALDDDSILALYNLGGSLDSNGVFHTYEYTEQ